MYTRTRLEHMVKNGRARGYRFGTICFIVGTLIGWNVKPAKIITEEVQLPATTVEEVVAPTPTPSPTPAPKVNYLVGEASYYSREGCVGCIYREGKSGYNLYMHNGDVLLDEELTVALTPPMFQKHKNKYVTIENISTGKATRAKVTDSGGFGESYGRIADMSVATKEAIGCNGLCKVKVTFE